MSDPKAFWALSSNVLIPPWFVTYASTLLLPSRCTCSNRAFAVAFEFAFAFALACVCRVCFSRAVVQTDECGQQRETNNQPKFLVFIHFYCDTVTSYVEETRQTRETETRRERERAWESVTLGQVPGETKEWGGVGASLVFNGSNDNPFKIICFKINT